MRKQLEIRPYRDGDEAQILELFERSFHSTRSSENWHWKYRRNPSGNLKISLAFSGDGNLVAHYAAYPCRFRDTSSGEPRTIVAHQIGDTMTSRQSIRTAGLGRPLLLEKMTRHFFTYYCRGQVGFNFGFNRGKIQRYYRDFVPGSRYLEAVPLRVLSLSGGLTVQPASDKDSAIRVERQHRIDPRWDELFHRVAADYRFLVERDCRYLEWRYLSCPDIDYSLHAAFDGQTLIGWSVFRQVNEVLVWGDALFDRSYPAAPGILLAQVLGQPEHSAARRVEGWFPDRPDWWSQALDNLGFEPRSDPQDLGLIYKPFQEPDLPRRLSNHLYFTKGDGDLF